MLTALAVRFTSAYTRKLLLVPCSVQAIVRSFVRSLKNASDFYRTSERAKRKTMNALVGIHRFSKRDTLLLWEERGGKDLC